MTEEYISVTQFLKLPYPLQNDLIIARTSKIFRTQKAYGEARCTKTHFVDLGVEILLQL